VLLEVYRRLSKKHNITVISATLRDNGKECVDYVEGIKVRRLKTTYVEVPGLPMPVPLMWNLREAVIKEASDIYHINNRYLYFFDTVNAIKKIRRKLALTLHDAMPRNIDSFTDNGGYFYDVVWGRPLMRYADVITAVSKNTIDTTVPNRYKKRAHVVYNGVDSTRYKYRSKKEERVLKLIEELKFSDSINIINNGRLVAQKGQVYLLRAMADLIKKHPDINFNLLIIGRGYLKDTLLYMAKDLGIKKNLRIVNGIPEKMLPYYYNLGDVFVSASLYEPASISVMEALASEVPVVATNVGGVPEMMDGNGIYAKPKSVSGIREGIETVINNNESAMRRAKKGRTLMKKEHDWGKIADRYEQLFSSTIRY
jgi:glycosyltransferase involved in cell wall biosynthesis